MALFKGNELDRRHGTLYEMVIKDNIITYLNTFICNFKFISSTFIID